MSAVCFYDTILIEHIYLPLLKWRQNPEEPRLIKLVNLNVLVLLFADRTSSAVTAPHLNNSKCE